MKKLLVSALAVVSMSGCSVLNSVSDDKIQVSCDAENPTIVVNGRTYNQNHVVANVSKGKPAYITCKADGYSTESYFVDTKLSKTGVLDAIGTVFFLFPVLGFTSDGAWTLDQNQVSLFPTEKVSK